MIWFHFCFTSASLINCFFTCVSGPATQTQHLASSFLLWLIWDWKENPRSNVTVYINKANRNIKHDAGRWTVRMYFWFHSINSRSFIWCTHFEIWKKTQAMGCFMLRQINCVMVPTGSTNGHLGVCFHDGVCAHRAYTCTHMYAHTHRPLNSAFMATIRANSSPDTSKSGLQRDSCGIFLTAQKKRPRHWPAH